MSTLRRTIHPETRVLDAKTGLVEYVASDETLDSYREILRADGWRFNYFEKNAPFVDSHDYSTVANQIGKVVDFKVVRRNLIETVQFAKDVAENTLAKIAWAMTEAGFLKAVSVGFIPVRTVSKLDSNQTEYVRNLKDLNLDKVEEPQKPRVIYVEQEQIELSACVIGANPNAVARAFKAGALTDADLETFSHEYERRHRPAAFDDALAAGHLARRRRLEFVEHLRRIAAKF